MSDQQKRLCVASGPEPAERLRLVVPLVTSDPKPGEALVYGDLGGERRNVVFGAGGDSYNVLFERVGNTVSAVLRRGEALAPALNELALGAVNDDGSSSEVSSFLIDFSSALSNEAMLAALPACRSARKRHLCARRVTLREFLPPSGAGTALLPVALNSYENGSGSRVGLVQLGSPIWNLWSKATGDEAFFQTQWPAGQLHLILPSAMTWIVPDNVADLH